MTPGSLPWMRAWHGDHLRRGAQLRLTDGRKARVLSTRNGFVAVRLWTSGQRLIVRPSELRVAA